MRQIDGEAHRNMKERTEERGTTRKGCREAGREVERLEAESRTEESGGATDLATPIGGKIKGE
jgi:hypothetical protein